MQVRWSYRLSLMLTTMFALGAQAAEPVKIAFIDPISGSFAQTGENGLRQMQIAAEKLVNEKGGVLGGRMLEIVPLDNQASPEQSLVQLKRAIGEGIRFIAQGNSSGVAHALTDAVRKHNERNPDQRVLYLNYSAVDPALTNEKCNFWHFRFDAHADMKMDALTDVIAANQVIKKVYIVGQDYSFGKAVAAAAVEMLTKKRTDITIVGNELHPIGKVKDFTPYATKIRASGADALITGNWGADMVGLGKAVVETGLRIPIYTYYGAGDGITATFGEVGEGVIQLVREGSLNPPTAELLAYFKAFKAVYPNGDLTQTRIANVIPMLARAIDKAGTDDPLKVALALEGMEGKSLSGSKLLMRAADHQLIQDLHIDKHTNKGILIDYDNSGYGLLTTSTVTMAGQDSPTSCKMERPQG